MRNLLSKWQESAMALAEITYDEDKIVRSMLWYNISLTCFVGSCVLGKISWH